MSYEDKYYVDAILTKEIIVSCTIKSKFKFLKRLGAKREWFRRKIWAIKFESQKEEARILMELNESGAAFSFDEHGWGPSCVFVHYREKGLVTGEICEISWSGPGKFGFRKR